MHYFKENGIFVYIYLIYTASASISSWILSIFTSSSGDLVPLLLILGSFACKSVVVPSPSFGSKERMKTLN